MALLQGEYTQISARNTFQEVDSSFEGQPKNAVNFGRVARELVELETSPDGFRTFEGDRLLVASHVHDFIDADRKLDRLGKGPAVANARKRELARIIPFNHAIRELVNNDRHIGRSDLLDFTVQTYMITHPLEFSRNPNPAEAQRRLQEVTKRVDDILRGMRSELTIEQVLGVRYAVDSEVDFIEEIKGIDMYVNIAPKDKEPWPVRVDAKTTEAAAIEARNKQPLGSEEVVLAANTDDRHYMGKGFYPKPGVIAEISPAIFSQFKRELTRAGHPDPSTL